MDTIFQYLYFRLHFISIFYYYILNEAIFIYLFYFKTLSSFQVTNIHTILGCIKDNIKQSVKQIIKAENNGDEMRPAEQAHDMDAYTLDLL